MNSIWKIIRHSGALWRYYVGISLLTLAASLTQLLMPMISGWAIDALRHGNTNVRYVLTLVVWLFILDVLGNVINNINGYYGDQMGAKLNALLSQRYYNHIMTLPQRYFDTELSGKIINRLNRSIVQIASFMNMMSNNFLFFIFSTVFALAVVAHYSWPVALMLFTLYPIYTWLTIRSSDKWQKWQQQRNEQIDIASGRFAEVIGQIKVVKSYVQQQRELQIFGKHIGKSVMLNNPQSRYWHTRDVRRRFFLNLVFLAVNAYVFVFAAKGNITPGQAVALILYAMQIRTPIFTISFLVEATQRAVADSQDYFKVMEQKPEIADIPGAPEMRVKRADIDFDEVSFGYDKNNTTLKNISFVAKAGQKVALVGESGEGKTTLVNLLLRLYEPRSGKIKIDNQDISQVTQSSLRQSIGVVFQESALFSGTIAENIGYADPKASKKQIITAAKAANAHDFIQSFDQQYDTQIGERGLRLSGGQKQRIAIARALLKDAPILILDEATSSLDSRSEHMVQEALDRLMRGRTTIIIAHRLSTIQKVDTIITLKNGQVDEIGKPAKLARSGGVYAELLRLQNGPVESADAKLKAYGITSEL